MKTKSSLGARINLTVFEKKEFLLFPSPSLKIISPAMDLSAEFICNKVTMGGNQENNFCENCHVWLSLYHINKKSFYTSYFSPEQGERLITNTTSAAKQMGVQILALQAISSMARWCCVTAQAQSQRSCTFYLCKWAFMYRAMSFPVRVCCTVRKPRPQGEARWRCSGGSSCWSHPRPATGDRSNGIRSTPDQSIH